MIGGLESTHEKLAESSRPPRQRVALSGRLLRAGSAMRRREIQLTSHAIRQFFKAVRTIHRASRMRCFPASRASRPSNLPRS
jgi:hypothetical protein